MTHTALPRLESAGIDSWMVRLFETIEENNLLWLSALTHDCEVAFGEALVDLVPSYTTLLVTFDPLRISSWEARKRLADVLHNLVPDDAGGEGELHEIATWYDTSVGPDLERVARLSARGSSSIRSTCSSSTSGSCRRSAAASCSNSSSGRVPQRKSDSRDASALDEME